MDGGGNESSNTETVDTSAENVAAADTTSQPQQVDEDDFDALPTHTTDALGRKVVNRIPHPRVKKMVERATQKQIAAIAKELGITKAEAELRLEDVTGALTERNAKYSTYEQRVQMMDQLEQIAASEPDRYMELLGQVNPAYKAFVKQVQQAQAQAAANTGDDDSPMPEPDYDLGDGRKTYSLDGLRARDEWVARRIERDVTKRLEERYKPIEERHKAELQREKDRKVLEQSEAKIQREYEKAQKWPGFKENADEIYKLFTSEQGKSLDLHDAYIQVVMPKLAADRQKIHDEALAKINAQPRSTSAASTASAPKTGGAKTTADIAREVARELGGL